MPPKALKFEDEVKRLVDDPLISKDSGVIIWGGKFHYSKLEKFLRAWKFSQMPYHIFEYTHRIEFKSNELPEAADYDFLEHARIFGKGGDLSLRRDGDLVLWHFIGLEGILTPLGFDVCNFWDNPVIKSNPDFKLQQHDESALLWGNYKEGLGRWQDDRVGWAELSYPINTEAKKQGKHVWIHYTVFTDGGQVAFVWWKELKDHD